ncbi:MFS transporter [Chamaesiphon sp. OTE_75_metabat_556]|uniref:MFS transporter n=1 Tax=Chamaesiphon sp. OTE_75_metabat_556 TaxID=2964692 RepID=UPI00286D05AE|nr:MFS transporter [Chamaesiphon sp. OTE_75_metabat_556]
MDLGLKTAATAIPIELQTDEAREIAPARAPTSRIRRSLQASSIDGVFAAIFSNLTGGVLLSNFLVDLQANSFEIGILAALPMIANIVQPIGAWWGDRSASRQQFCTRIYVPARLVWVLLLVGIVLHTQQLLDDRMLAILTMVVVALGHILAGLGSPTWLSWMAALVPRQLRGRYFGIRNTAANLTSLIVVAIAGFLVANDPNGEISGFAIALSIGIVAGIISIICQQQMVDVNPHDRIETADLRNIEPNPPVETPITAEIVTQSESAIATIGQDRHFQGFLWCLGAWTFALNLSAPFFNLYLLKDLSIDVGWVTLYNSLTSVANLALLMPFGRWSDRIGHRLPLLVMGLVMTVLPLLWLGVGTDSFSLWLGLPLLFAFNGGATAAIELCINNLQLEIAHDRHQSQYFGIAAAIAGIAGAAGTVVGGGLDLLDALGGLTGLFVISSFLRLLALIPLLLLQHEGERSLLQQLLDFGWLGRLLDRSDSV